MSVQFGQLVFAKLTEYVSSDLIQIIITVNFRFAELDPAFDVGVVFEQTVNGSFH